VGAPGEEHGVANCMMKLLDLPIYRRPQAAHASAFDTKREKAVEAAAAQWGDEYAGKLKSRDPDGWYTWRYNDVEAWLAVSIDRGLIEGALYVREKNATGRAHPWVLEDHSFVKVHCSRLATSSAIQTELIGQIQAAVAERFPKKYLDHEGLRLMGTWIDWKGLAEEAGRSHELSATGTVRPPSA
jgi:hypothetical protein